MKLKNLIRALEVLSDDENPEVLVAVFGDHLAEISDIESICVNGDALQINIQADLSRESDQ